MRHYLFLCLVALISLSGCNPLSDEAKEIAGNYFIPELSEKVPVMELGKNGKCTITALRENVLKYSVQGKWNVKKDSLIIKLDPSSLTFEGDSSLIGNVPEVISRKITGHNDFMLQLEKDSVTYYYQRRNE